MNSQLIQSYRNKQVAKNKHEITQRRIPYMTDLSKENEIVSSVTLGEFLNT